MADEFKVYLDPNGLKEYDTFIKAVINEKITTLYNKLCEDLSNEEALIVVYKAILAVKAEQDSEGNIIRNTYALKSELNNYALKSALDAYLTQNDLVNYALKTDLNSYALKSSVSGIAEDVNDIINGTITVMKAKKDSEGNIISETYALISALTSYALKTDLNSYATKSSVSGLSETVNNIINGDTAVEKAKKDSNGNIISETYALKSELPSSGGGSSLFNIIDRVTMSVNSYQDLTNYIKDYNEIMIVVRIVSSTEIKIGISNTTSGNTGFLCSTSVSGTTYIKILLNKTDEGYYAWDVNGSFGWASGSGYKYLKNYTTATSATISVVIHGR